MRVVLDLRAEFGAKRATYLRRGDDGVWRARLGDAQVMWTGAARGRATARPIGGAKPLAMTLELEPGDHA